MKLNFQKMSIYHEQTAEDPNKSFHLQNQHQKKGKLPPLHQYS